MSNSIPRPMRGNTPWRDRADSHHNGGVSKAKTTKAAALPSETFDWDRALEGYRRILKEVYGGEA